MKVGQVIDPLISLSPEKQLNSSEKKPDISFGDVLKNAVKEVNDLQNQASEMKTQFITGEIENVHDVMIASEKASLAFEMTLQVRNKIVEAYQEIMRMQV